MLQKLSHMEETMDITDKIRKLLALSTSSNENEAAVAAEMASSLALKYNIDLLGVQISADDYKENDVLNSTKTERWISNIVAGLCLINACKHYLVIDPDGSVVYRVVGKPHSIDIVNQLTTYLTDTVRRLNREHITKYYYNQQERAHYRKAFRLAASQRLYQRFSLRYAELKQKDHTLTPTTNALVVSDYFDSERKNIDDFLQNHNIKTKTQRSLTLRSTVGYQDGSNAASTINLGEQIHGVRNCRQVR